MVSSFALFLLGNSDKLVYLSELSFLHLSNRLTPLPASKDGQLSQSSAWHRAWLTMRVYQMAPVVSNVVSKDLGESADNSGR